MEDCMAKRWFVFTCSLVAYAAFLLTVLYGIGFVGNIYFQKTLDRGISTTPASSSAVDLALIALFGFQHSLMARDVFKKLILKFVPEPAERSVFVTCASLCLLLLFWQWRPIDHDLWNVSAGPVPIMFNVLYASGWLIVIVSTFLINHFDFTGLRQAYSYLIGRECTPLEFRQPLLYKLVRHPMMLGLLFSFWATARMSLGHLMFSTGMTVYILIGLAFEERDLMKNFGDTYQQYREQVPMLIPMLKRRRVMPDLNAIAASSPRE